MPETKLTVSYAPHIGCETKINTIMLDVVTALMPAALAGTVIFGYRAALLMAVCVTSCVLFEFLWQKVTRQAATISDLSAVVTGLLFAMNLPVTFPFWMAVTGCLFAIVIVKQFFGGLGKNFLNPALAARAFVVSSWLAHMTKWTAPFYKNISLFGITDAVTSATPLAILKETLTASNAASEAAQTITGQLPAYWNLFFGSVSGCIGETSVLAILLGLAYLLYRKVISVRIPLIYIGTVAVLTCVFGGRGLLGGDWLYHIMSGGLMLGAVFMATDYTTTPITAKGEAIFALGCGILTSVIRLYSNSPEGVSYSILIMNVATPLIDRFARPRRFGKKEENCP